MSLSEPKYRLPLKHAHQKTVAVAISGGLDSASACLLLRNAGCDVVGIHMRLWDSYSKDNVQRTARGLAEEIGIPYYELDLRTEFKNEVVDPFIEEYLNGRTPNPCIQCNRHFKFDRLRKYAESLNIPIVATGHYAQTKQLETGEYALFVGEDYKKDQSYFLYSLGQRDLKNTLFPLGAFTKEWVRDYALSQGVAFAPVEDSQDICFIDSTIANFIESHRDLSDARGSIVNEQGDILGEHKGIYRYTVGQRRGLGIAAEAPLYVLSLSAKSKTVTVGYKEELKQKGLSVFGVNWPSGKVPSKPFIALAKLRYRHPGLMCQIEPQGKNEARVLFLDNWTTISPGQSVVFYQFCEQEQKHYVVGGGIIGSN